MGWKKYKERVFFAVLLGYHLFFTFLTWDYYSKKGGDAAFYWFQLKSSAAKAISEYRFYGSDVVLLLNYPLAKGMGLDIRVGFILYSLIGFLGIIQFYRLCRLFMERKFQYKGIDIYLLLLLLPNLHFWTALLGKEALCFLFLATILLEFRKEQYRSIPMMASVVFLILIRPHIALLLLVSVFAIYLFFGKGSAKMKLMLSGIALMLFSVLFYMFLQLSEIKRFDWSRIQRYNEFSLLSFKESGTYVPIIEYSYPYKIFTFYFRPFVNEIPGLYGTALGLENMLLLLLHVVAFVLILWHWKKIVFPFVFKIILLFAILSGLFIVQRYSGFGIFARTKIMFQPFVALVLLWIIAEVRHKKIIQVK